MVLPNSDFNINPATGQITTARLFDYEAEPGTTFNFEVTTTQGQGSADSAARALVRITLLVSTLKCLSIGTPKTVNFPIVPIGNLMVFRCPNI